MLHFPRRSCGHRLLASKIAAVIAFAVVAGGLAEAAPETDREQLVVTAGNALLDKLVGAWVLSGTMAGKHTIHDVTASRTLNGNYVRLDEISRDRDAEGRPAYQATVFVGWNSRTKNYICIWLDSTAVANVGVTCTAQPRPNAIPFVFRDSRGRRFFENTFSYEVAANQWKWELNDLTHDKRTAFARVVLRQK